jgi:hypothetical protein
MAGQDDGVIRQRKQFLTDAFEKEVFFASGKIPAPDALPKENVSTHNNSFIEQVDTNAPGTVSWHVVYFYRCTQKLGGSVLVKEKISFERIDLQSKTPAAEELGIRYHWCGLGMHRCFAFMALNDCRRLGDMIKVTMRYCKELYLFACEGGVCSLGGVEKNATSRRLVVKAIGVKHTPCKGFEPIHEKMVREKMMWQFDFPASVCKFFTSSIR